MMDWLYRKLGQYDGFYTRPPMCSRKLYFEDDKLRLISFNNDGHEVWIGSVREWYFFTSHREFRKIIFWYLRQWAFVDWFGLRTWLWFKLLHRHIKKNNWGHQ